MKNAVKRFVQMFKNDERGLTLVELLAVVVILAIVGLIAFVSIGNVIENSKKDAHIANAQQVISAAELYEASGGEIPVSEGSGTGVSALKTLDTIDELINPWTKNEYVSKESTDEYDFLVKKVLIDDTTNEYEIQISSTQTECLLTDKTKLHLSEQGRKACNSTGDSTGD